MQHFCLIVDLRPPTTDPLLPTASTDHQPPTPTTDSRPPTIDPRPHNRLLQSRVSKFPSLCFPSIK